MELKFSKFNHYTYIDKTETLLLYNKLRNTMGYLQPISLRNLPLSIDTVPEKMMGRLRDHGFVVPASIDESIQGDDLHEKIINSSSLHFTILTSESCNFGCQYCFDDFQRSHIKESVIQDLITYAKRNIGQYTEMNVAWFGGEPLLARDSLYTLSEAFIDICRKTSRRYSASITTNGYLLDYETFKRLLRYRVFEYIITIDGTAKTHNASRPLKNGGGTFHKIIENLRCIRDHVKSQQFRIVLRTNITTDVLENLHDYLSFVQEEFGKDNRFTYLFSPVYDWGGNRINAMRGKLIDSMSDVYATLAEGDWQLNMSALQGQLSHAICSYAQKNTYTVNTLGDVFLCPQLQEYPIGKLINGKLEIDEYKAAYWYSLSAKAIEGCKSCTDYSICKGKSCVRNLLFFNKNPMDPAQLNCGREYAYLNDVLKVLYKMNKDSFIEL